MIAYFDTSALIPLIVEEPSTPVCQRLWNEASRVASVRLLYAEASAALARAHRMARLTTTQLDHAIRALEDIVVELDHVEVTDQLVRTAGALAHTHGLRGYDAVHLGAGLSVYDDDVVFVTGDSNLAAAAQALGIAVSNTNA
ncbi:MAG: type II toxin-antitoxin system VapC family toxin [Actinomycetia bacterium]|nr:type II toxin-antitoxin system VapC family toxin [Actinomycetes bacterium]MCP4959505.1 type II toxin-antitoxin system VapC family toxin [Actinomycetes bacterium]